MVCYCYCLVDIILWFSYLNRDGNIPDISKAGSMTEFLIDLHKQHGGIVSFWIGKQFTVSIATPDLFKEVSHIFDRPGERSTNVSPISPYFLTSNFLEFILRQPSSKSTLHQVFAVSLIGWPSFVGHGSREMQSC